MSCNTQTIRLDRTISGETWGGLTLTIDGSDDTAFADTLALVRMSWIASDGTTVMTISSATSAITINTATAYAWNFTVEPLALPLPADTYSWFIETTDSAGVVNKDFMAGTQEITDDPHS
jgi:hypothetical protein